MWSCISMCFPMQVSICIATDILICISISTGSCQVRWANRKSDVGKVGNHFMESSVLVFVQAVPSTPLVFELTRNNHMKEGDGKAFTVTACFVQPPKHLVAHAWRILLDVCRGKELLPSHVRPYACRAVARAGEEMPEDAGEGPDSASPGDALASSSGPLPPRGADVPARSAGQALPALRHGPPSFQQPQGRPPPRTTS